MKNLQFCLITLCANNARRRTILVSVIAIVCILTSVNYVKQQKRLHMRQLNDCFHNAYPVNVQLLADIRHEPQPVGSKNVFFVETSCSTTGHVQLNARQMCAIESAAKNNPTWNIFVLFAAQVGFSNDTAAMVNVTLKTYANIHFRRLNLTSYADGTPMDAWMRGGTMFESNYVNSHLSDILRYLTLYKYGGTYLDLDVVVLKELDSIGVNYSGAESSEDVAAGVMNFEPDGFGHQVAELCIRDLLKNFDGYNWGNNGPGVITRVLQSFCLTTRADRMTRERCYGFTVYPPSAFYAIPWRKFRLFFNETALKEATSMLQDSTVAHVWNKHSHKVALKVGTQVLYGKLAEAHCPVTYATCGEYF